MPAEQLRIQVTNRTKHFRKITDSKGNVLGEGTFSLHLVLTPATGTLYVPLSIASGKKPTGLVYLINGTGESSIVTAHVEIRDIKASGVREILLGTIRYVEIPQGVTATLRVRLTMRGRIGKEYSVLIARMQYKTHLSDTRYQKEELALETDVLKFR